MQRERGQNPAGFCPYSYKEVWKGGHSNTPLELLECVVANYADMHCRSEEFRSFMALDRKPATIDVRL